MKAFAWIVPAAIFAVSFTAAPVKADSPKPTAPAEADGTITGTVIPRPNGNFLGLEIIDNNFRLSTYNKHKKPEKGDFTQAVLHWSVHYQPNEERTLLTPSDDGLFLTSEKPIRAPHSFKLFIALFVAGKEDPVESYVIDFQG